MCGTRYASALPFEFRAREKTVASFVGVEISLVLLLHILSPCKEVFFGPGVRSAGGGAGLSDPPSPLCLLVVSARFISFSTASRQRA